LSAGNLKETAVFTTAANTGVAPRAVPATYGAGVQFDYTNAGAGTPNAGPRLTIRNYGG